MNAQVAIAELQARIAAAPADHSERQYLNLLRDILENGVRRDDRTLIYNVWAHAYGIQSLVALHGRAADAAAPAAPAKAWSRIRSRAGCPGTDIAGLGRAD
jgi:hypothetical protein